MKKIIFLSLISLICKSQTNLDILVFEKINQYRTFLGIKEVKWDSICFRASKHHSSYLYRKNVSIWPKTFCGHSEDTLKSHPDRYKFYSKNKRFLHLGEVALTISKNYKVNDVDILDKMATHVLEAWKSSPEHNRLILNPDFLFGGVDCQYFTNPTGVNTSLNYRIVATMLLVK